MHPFLPALSVIFLLAAAGAATFLRMNAGHPEVAAHASSLHAVIVLSLLIGGGLALWLRRFGIRFPGWTALPILLWAVLSTVL